MTMAFSNWIQHIITGTLIAQMFCLDCSELLMGQYKCEEPSIDSHKQAEVGCQENRTVKVPCKPVQGVVCDGKEFDGDSIAFYKEVPCRYVGEKKFTTALLLSIFLGTFGIDRFYLGYPAIGLLKFCTLGFFLIFQLVDVILIAAQVLKPADGTDYVIDYYGPRLIHLSPNEDTYYLYLNESIYLPP